MWGSLFVVGMLMMLPSISAATFNAAVTTNDQNFIEKIKNVAINIDKKRIKELSLSGGMSNIVDLLLKKFTTAIFGTSLAILLAVLIEWTYVLRQEGKILPP